MPPFAGCADLKLSDGRKRSMSLWVEFITASGYLSARKIRCRFQTLVAQVIIIIIIVVIIITIIITITIAPSSLSSSSSSSSSSLSWPSTSSSSSSSSVSSSSPSPLSSHHHLHRHHKYCHCQACDKSSYRDSVKMMNDASEVKIRIREKYVVQITPAFKCNGVWPRSAAQWPSMTMAWPHPNMAAQVSKKILFGCFYEGPNNYNYFFFFKYIWEESVRM